MLIEQYLGPYSQFDVMSKFLSFIIIKVDLKALNSYVNCPIALVPLLYATTPHGIYTWN